MPYVKVTGYIDVPDDDLDGDDFIVTDRGYEEIKTVYVGDLYDLRIAHDDRGDLR